MSDTPQAADPYAVARQQMYVARAQAVALVATIDAALASIPNPSPAPKQRLSYMGADEEA